MKPVLDFCVDRRRMYKYFILICCLSSLTYGIHAQDNRLVQVSGIVFNVEDSKIKVLPYAEVSIMNSYRAVYADDKGFYSIAAQRGDTLSFNYLSYEEEKFIIPMDYFPDMITLNQVLKRDTIYLPKALINPWPDKNHFRPEFLAMNVEESMQEIAMANLAQDRIRELMTLTARDGQENASFYLRQQAEKYYYAGQIPPQRILSPGAWIEFFKAWKRGDFKRKKK
ncbi:MAG: carboxypeptidase-like regulatory domain-containing protein [Saprospiraceae bacterium]